MNNAVLAIDIGAGMIKMLYGDSRKVVAHQEMETPEGAVEDNRILKIDRVYQVIADFVNNSKIKPKLISFSIYGQDIVTRHIEIPYMKEENIKQTIEWEIGQNLPDSGVNYYIDYELLNREEAKKTKLYKVLVVAAPKDRVDLYVALAQKLNIKLKAIDITANCTARVFKKLTVGKSAYKSIGAIDIGHANTSITIVENGRFAIERQVPFGMEKLQKEIMKNSIELQLDPREYLQTKFNPTSIDSELDQRINRLLDNVFTSFQKVIQFYATGKIEKDISQLYVFGGGSGIHGIDEIIKEYLTSPTTVVTSRDAIGLKIKLPQDCSLSCHINTLGLLLRED